MKSTLILFSIIGLIFISEINPAFAVADSCVKLIEHDDLPYYNNDSVMVDTCVCPNYRNIEHFDLYTCLYAKKRYFIEFNSSCYPFKQIPIPKDTIVGINAFDAKFATIVKGFDSLEKAFGACYIKRWDYYVNSDTDSIHIVRPQFLIEFKRYCNVDSILNFLSSIDSISWVYFESVWGMNDVDDKLPQIIDENTILISPNPSTDFIEISLWAGSEPALTGAIRIFDVYGQTVMSVGAIHELPLRLYVSGLAPGMYFVRVGDKVQKFVKI